MTILPSSSYTVGIKTAISLPDVLFAQAERLAESRDLSRSELYRRAIEEYLARHAPDRVTSTLDKLAGELDTQPDAFVSIAGRRTVERVEW